MERRKPPPMKFEVAIYDGEEIEVKTMTREEAEAINPRDYDYYIARCFGVLAFRTASGEWIEYRNGNRPGIGPEGLKIVQALQVEPGIFQTCSDLAELTGNDNYYGSNCVSARLLALRKAHHESKEKSHFFVTSDSGQLQICWPKERTYVWIDSFRSRSDEAPEDQE